MEALKGLKVAILVEDGFEQVELTEPRKALDQAGAETRIVSPRSERVRGWNFRDWGDEFPVDVALERARPQDFDALLLPGGVMNPDTLRMQAQAAVRGLDLPRLMPLPELAEDAIGRVGGDISLAGTGNSVAKMLATSNGDVALGMGRGQVSNLLMEFAGLDIMEALKFLITGDRKVPIRCAFADFAVTNGVMSARSLAFDTTDTIIVGEGTIDLRNEALALTLRPRPKDRSLFVFRSPLLVRGTFVDPSFAPDPARIGLRAAFALALGSIAPPAALLATLELGPGEDANCGGRYAK